jgi:hypothetical protein
MACPLSSGGQFNQIKDAANTVLADYNYNPRGELAQIDRAATAPDKVWSNAAGPLNPAAATPPHRGRLLAADRRADRRFAGRRGARAAQCPVATAR